MPRIRILAGVAGENRSPGEELDLPGNEAQELIRQGRAELIRSLPIETPEGTKPERTARKSTTRK